MRYTEQGSVTLRVSYLRQTAAFEILDTGIGMTAGQMERLFQPFERGDPARQDHGLGLGLTIARMLTALMGGEMTVDSTPGQGTRFTIKLYLPELRTDVAAEAAEALRGEFDLTPAGIIRVLDLQRPIYYPTAAYGHFGRTDVDLPWERTGPGRNVAASQPELAEGEA